MIIETGFDLQNLKLQIKNIYPIEKKKKTKISLNNISTAFLCELLNLICFQMIVPIT